MNSDVVSIRKVKEVKSIPHGEYPGVWGGYIVEVTINGSTYELKTKTGVRGMGIPVHVISNDEGIFIR